MKLAELLARFDDVTEEADGYIVTCPAHPDSHPSLRVALSDTGRMMLYCRAGCATTDILTALGLVWGDLFDAEAGGDVRTASSVSGPVSGAPVAALAHYRDLTAAALHDDTESAAMARRYLADRFGIDDTTAKALGLGVDPGGHTFGLEYLSTTYRRCPRLVVPFIDPEGVPRGAQGRDLTGTDPVRWCGLSNPSGMTWAKVAVFDTATGLDVVIITEGPGDALTAVGAGFNAVAVRGAAIGKAASALAGHFGARHVCVAGDRDAAGDQFNNAVTDALDKVGVQVAVIDIPARYGDLTAWREAGPASFPAALGEAVRAAVPLTVTDRFTDLGNADRLFTFLDGNVRFSPEVGFFLYDGTVWQPDRFNKVRAAAQRVTREMIRDARRMADDDASKAFVAWARRSQGSRSIDSMLKELAAMPAVVVDVEDMDAHLDLLAFANGEVDLRTGELRPHDRDHLMTRRVDADYLPTATCPTWERFLADVFPSPAMADYLRRLIGYGITGHTTEQCFVVMWGTGSNGKSVFTDTLTTVFRSLTVTTPFATFEERSSGGIPNDIAALKGARLVMASEGERGKPMSESTLKRVTGSDRISARFMRKEFFEFKPTSLILLATNHRPAFKGQDEGLWRRVKLVAWERFFTIAERDHQLTTKLAAEAEGIAAWAVRGAQEWYANGLDDPPEVINATQSYRDNSDALAGFFPGVLERHPGATMLAADVYRLYSTWCDDEGLGHREVWSRRAVNSALEERGVKRGTRSAKGPTFAGIRLAAPNKSEKVRTPARPLAEMGGYAP